MALSYSDLFDFPGYNQAIKDITASNRDFAASLKEFSLLIKGSLGESRTILNELASGFQKFSVAGRGAKEQLVGMAKDSEAATARFREQQIAVQALISTQDLSTKSINQLKAGAKELQKQYEALGGASADVRAKKEALAQEFKRVTEAIGIQNEALKKTTVQIKYAADSYKGMQAELTTVGNALKTLPNAFSNTTGKINANNKEAVALQARYVQLNNSLKTIDQSLGNHQRNVGNYSSALHGAGEKITEFGSSLLTVAGISLGAIGIEKFFESAVEEANKAEAANSRLANILSNIGRGDAFDRIKGKAEELTKTFKYLNQADVTEVFGKLITYGKLTENQINDLVPVILDFAAKQKISIEEATGVVTKGLEGNARALKEYGINIKDGSNVTERFGLIMTGLKARVDGAGAAFEKTFPGQLAITREEIVETEKEIGEKLIPLFSYLLKAANSAFDGIKKIFSNLGNIINKGGNIFAGAGDSAIEEAIKFAQEDHDKRIKSIIDSYSKNANGTTRAGQQVLAELIKASKYDVQRLEDAVKGGNIHEITNLTKYVNDNTAAINKVKESINPDGNRILGAGGSGSSKAEQAKALTDYEKELAEKQKILKEKLDAEINLNQDKLDKEEISEVQFSQFKYDSSVKYNQKASALEKATNSVGYKAKEENLLSFKNVELKANAEFDKAIVKSGKDVEKSHLEAKQKAIEDAANLEIKSIKDAEQYELANKALTNAARVKLEIDYLDKIDEITIRSLQDRAALELDAAKRVALLAQATQLRGDINNRDAFGTNISIPKATAQDNIKDLLEREARLKSLGILTIEQEISTAKKIIEIRKSVGEDTAADEQKLFDLRVKKAGEFVDYLKQSAAAAGLVLGQGVTAALDDIITSFDKIRKGGELTFADIARFGIDAGNAITENYKLGIEDQLATLDAQKQQELKAAGNNAAAQAAIEAKYQKESAALKRKEAIADRENAIFQIAINTAVAAVKALPNLFLSGAIIAFGLLETALVLSRPLPKFAKGTENAPEGWAEVDEMGAELVIDKHGRLKEVGGNSGSRYTYLEKGDKVKTATDTKRILANMESEAIVREIGLNGRLSSNLRANKQNEAVYMLARAIEHNSGSIDTDRIVSAIKNIPIHQTIIDEKGQRARLKDGLQTTDYLGGFKLSR